MVKPIMKDIFFLNQKSEPATKADLSVVEDLLDTLDAKKDVCVGLAANMIGVKKRIHFNQLLMRYPLISLIGRL